MSIIKDFLRYIETPWYNVHSITLLPPINEVWGKIICLQVCVCPQGGCLVPGGAWSRGSLVPGGSGPRGVPGSGGCLVPEGGCLILGGLVLGGGGAWSQGCLVESPPDGYCCGQYASYWNAFLSVESLTLHEK